MSHGEVLPNNTDDPYFEAPAETPAEDTPPEARMATTSGEPGLSKVPSITQSMLREDPGAEPETE
jgi:hypothetical protein